MSTIPAVPAGEVATICVEELTVKVEAFKLPNETEVAPVKLVPVIVTLVPPAVVPLEGETEVIAGVLMGVTYEN